MLKVTDTRIRLLLILVCVAEGCTAVLDFDALQKAPKEQTEDSETETDTDTVAAPQLCTNDSECDDGIDCTGDRCNASGLCVQEPNNSLCPGFEVCKTDKGCVDIGRECLTEADCNDGVDCTRNSCSTAGKCETLYLDDDVCVDTDNLCMSGIICDATLGCIGGNEKQCTQDEGPSCYNNVCMPSTGHCDDRVFRPGADKDADGYCNSDAAFGGDDCDDNLETTHPDAEEIDNNQVDDNCDGVTDEIDSD